jgi:hypothetical protein
VKGGGPPTFYRKHVDMAGTRCGTRHELVRVTRPSAPVTKRFATLAVMRSGGRLLIRPNL